MRHTFGTGEWVEVIAPQHLKMKHKNRFSELVHSETPMTDDEEIDRAAVDAMPGGWSLFLRQWRTRRSALVAAVVLTDWSYAAPRPQVSEDGTQLLNRESLDEADLEFAPILDKYLALLTNGPDPKEATTSTSNGRSPAKETASQKG